MLQNTVVNAVKSVSVGLGVKNSGTQKNPSLSISDHSSRHTVSGDLLATKRNNRVIFPGPDLDVVVNFSDSLILDDAFWALAFGNGPTSRVFAFDTVTKQKKSFSPIILTTPANPSGGALGTRSMTSDGENIWVSGNVSSSSSGSKYYLWKINKTTGAQTLYDLTGASENSLERAMVTWAYGVSQTFSGGETLTITVDGTPYLFPAMSAVTKTTAEMISDLTTFYGPSGLNIPMEFRQAINPNTTLPEIMFLANNSVLSMDVSGTAITGFGGYTIHDPMYYNRGRGIRGISYDPVGDKLWIFCPRYRSFPFVVDPSTGAIVSTIDGMYFPCMLQGEFESGPLVIAAGSAVAIRVLDYTLSNWNSTTFLPISQIGLFFDQINGGIATDGRYVYTFGEKYDPQRGIIIDISDSSGGAGPVLVTQDRVYVFRFRGTLASELQQYTKDSLRTIRKDGTDAIWGAGGFFGSPQNVSSRFAFDGTSLWLPQGTVSQYGVTKIIQVPLEPTVLANSDKMVIETFLPAGETGSIWALYWQHPNGIHKNVQKALATTSPATMRKVIGVCQNSAPELGSAFLATDGEVAIIITRGPGPGPIPLVGDDVYLSPYTPGAVVAYPPSTEGYVDQRIGIIIGGVDGWAPATMFGVARVLLDIDHSPPLKYLHGNGFVSAAALNAASLVYKTSITGNVAAGRADVIGTANVIAVSQPDTSIASAGVAVKIYTDGVVRVNCQSGITISEGDQLYLSSTSYGLATNVAPAISGEYVVPVGVVTNVGGHTFGSGGMVYAVLKIGYPAIVP